MTEVESQVDVDPALGEETVLALVRRHFPSAKGLTGVDESGRKGRAYLIDDGLVLKTRRPIRLRGRRVEEFETSLEKEAFFLRQMNAAGLPVPRLLGFGREGKVEYECMTRMPGAGMRRAGVPADARPTVLRELGRTLRRVHSLPQAPFLESGLFPNDGSPDETRTKLQGLFARLVNAIHEVPERWPISASPEAVAARAIRALPRSTVTVALHSNPAPEHVFVDPDTGVFQGLIDFGDAYIGHPAFDLRPYREPADYVPLLEGYAEAGKVSDEFIVTWKVGLVLGEMAGFVRGRQFAAQFAENLNRLLAEV